MTKEAAYGLGSGLTILMIFAYGLKHKMGWKYWVFTMLFLAPAGGLVLYSLVPEDKAATAFDRAQKAQQLSYDLKQDEIEACRKRECSDKGGFYMNDGRCRNTATLASFGNFEWIDLKC